jgi:peptidoglycan-N-acetylglucosamine deacetylase
MKHWSQLMRWSVPWHGAMALGWALAPGQWPVWLSGLAANHAALTGAGLTPRSSMLGPNLTRLPESARAQRMIALTFDDGPDPAVTPKVLALLAQARAQASFFCIGRALRQHPEIAESIVKAGHSLENHTQVHSHQFSFLGPAGFRREIAAAQATIAKISGTAPRFFRAPAGLRNPLLQPVLAELGLQLTSWTRRGFDTVAADAERVYQRLEKNLAAGDILLLHDGHAARSHKGTPVILEVLPRLLNRIAELELRAVSLPQAFHS